MIAKLVAIAVRSPLIVAILALFLVGIGIRSYLQLDIEAYPNPVAPMIEIIGQPQGWSAEEVERYVSIPLETGLVGMPGLDHIRSQSLFGLADVKCYFGWDTPYATAQQRVLNQLVFITSRGELLRKTLSAPTGEGWEELPPPARGIGALCCADGVGTLWYRDGDKHLWRLQGSQFVPLPEAAGLAGQSVNCLTTDSQGRLWVGTDIGFAVWNGREFQSAVPVSPAPSPLDVEALTVTDAGQIWALANGGVCAAAEGRGRAIDARACAPPPSIAAPAPF